MDTSNDYYTVLGVDSRASTGAIKAAFKRLALQYHPDVYKGDDAQERMRSLLQAYQTLSDPVARKAYDDRHSGVRATTANGPVGRDEFRARKTAAEEGRYVFPDLHIPQTSPVTFKLAETTYQLTPTQAEHLQWDGLLRGVLSDTTMPATGTSYGCQRCHHSWSVPSAAEVPLACPACHARDWAEYLLLRCTHCQAVFASAEIHDPLRGNALYHPYELFPLCPHCRRSQWCPAENQRVSTLRAAVARRNALLTGSLVGVCLLLIVVIALVLLR